MEKDSESVEVKQIEYLGDPKYAEFVEKELNKEIPKPVVKDMLQLEIEKQFAESKPTEEELAKSYQEFVKKSNLINETKRKFNQKKFRNKLVNLTPKKKRKR